MRVGVAESRGKLVHGILIEHRLFSAQLAERFHFGLFRQVGDDRLVRLQPAQNVGSHQLAKWPVGIVSTIRQAFGKLRKLLRRAQQPGIDEVEDGP